MDRRIIGPRRSILAGLVIYLFVTVWGAFIDNRGEFYVMALLIGTVQGGVQALSRSLFARIIPADKAAQYFGFYNMIGKFASIMGPVLVAASVLLARSFDAGPHLAPRISIVSIAVLFIGGGCCSWAWTKRKARGRLPSFRVEPGPGRGMRREMGMVELPSTRSWRR